MNLYTNVAVAAKSELETLKTVERELRAKKAELKAAEAKTAWEAKVAARNSNYVIGSRRKATPEDVQALGHSHGEVCSIRCMTCGATRTINVQDAHQSRYCKQCRKEAMKAAAQESRTSKRLAGKSVENLLQQIEEAQKALEVLKASKVA